MADVGSWWTLFALWLVVLVALLVLRRWRHLIVWLGVFWGSAAIIDEVAPIARRPRPFGVDLRAGWGGWAMPSMQMAVLTGFLAVLYTLVPEGRWRNTGKWVVTGLVTLIGGARRAGGGCAHRRAGGGRDRGRAPAGWRFRRFTPSEVFPVTYRRGRSAHLDVEGRARARRSGGRWRTSSA